MLVPTLAAVGAVLVAVDSVTWWHAVGLGLGVVAALVAVERWTAGDLSRFMLPCLIVTAAVWAWGALAADAHSAFYGLAIVGPLVVPDLPRGRGAAAVALVAFVAAVGVTKFFAAADVSLVGLILYLVIPTGVTGLATGFMFANKRFYELVKELEQSRQREAELAVDRERARFASELHDIQGHTLHVVKLKVTLAEKLLRSNVERASDELREVRGLVSDTITQTKELAYAQRKLNLTAELENAKNLFEAAGIDVHADRAAEVDGRAGELLGQVLRETTTNILRHAQAARVDIELTPSGISIANDGVAHDALPELGGLATLRERLAAEGGTLTVELRDGRFLTSAAFAEGDAR